METFTFRLYRGGEELKELAMLIKVSGRPEAKIRFQSLWSVCSDDAEAAALIDADGQIVWGAVRPQRG